MIDSIKAIFLIMILYNFFKINQTFENKTYILSQSNHFELVQRSIPLFENKTLTVCVVVREPFVLFGNSKAEPELSRSHQLDDYNPIKDLNSYSGIAIEVLKLLGVIFKFKVNLVRPPDNEFGILKANRSWSGVVGQLARKQADIGVTALSITLGRSEVIDFTRAYYVETAAILLPIPEEVQNYSAMIEPFSTPVWLLLLTTIVILIFLISIMTKLEEDQQKQHKLAVLLEYRARQKSLTTAARDKNDEENSKVLENDLGRLQEKLMQTTWLDRFYYATTCVLNILLIRGKFLVLIIGGGSQKRWSKLKLSSCNYNERYL